MKGAVILRITGFVCFIIALVLCIFKISAQMPLLYAAMVMLSVISGILSSRTANLVLKGVISLIPGLPLIFAGNVRNLIFLAVPFLFFWTVNTLGPFLQDAWRARLYVKVSMIFFLIVFLFTSFTFKSANFDGRVYGAKGINVPALSFGAAFIFLEVTALRKMRMGAEMDLAWNGKNVLMVMAPVGAAAIAGVGIYYLGLGLAKGFSFLLKPLESLIYWITSLFQKPEPPPYSPALETATAATMAVASTPESGTKATEELSEAVHASAKIQHAGTIFLTVVIIAAVALVVLLIIRFIYHNRPVPEEEEEAVYEETEKLWFKKKRKEKDRVWSRAERVRRIYREYMDLVQQGGVLIRPEDTSQAILDNSEKVFFGDDDKALREVYIKARYGDPDSITQEEVIRAESCLRALKREPGA